VVQLRARDSWIGWNPEEFRATIKAGSPARWAKWLERSLSQLIKSIYLKDLRSEGLLDRKTIGRPTTEGIARLRRFALAERRLHHLYPKRQMHKTAADGGHKTDWEAQARTHLFRSKRAAMLADLLDARRRLQAGGFTKALTDALQRAMTSQTSYRALRTVLRHVKAAHAGIDMMDISVCGAIAPYNTLLGGKLVSLLMASPEVVTAYTKRYKSAVSVIASAIAGRAVCRRPNLVLLGTTSLYDVAPAQYNRLRMPARIAGGRDSEELAFVPLGRTVGFGSYHFSRETLAALDLVLARRHGGRPVNSIFGEGVNPKLRKVRTALDLLSLPSDSLLQHGNHRVIYAVPLARNFRAVLLGVTDRPKWIVPQSSLATRAIISFWRDRWFAKRVERPGLLEAVAIHSVGYPVRHGARVPLPDVASEQGPLFAKVADSFDSHEPLAAVRAISPIAVLAVNTP